MAAPITIDSRSTSAPSVEVALPASGAIASEDHTLHAVAISAPSGAPEAPEVERTRKIGTVAPATVAVAGAAVVGAAALFTTGLMYKRIMQASGRMAADALEIRIPLWLPVALVGIAREVLFYRRTISAANADLYPTSEADTHLQA
jgi:hypothetical protein